MIDREHIVAAVVEAAGGTLTGRVRLQKTVYLLDRLGLGTGFQYEYHHYGPYSRDIDNATADAKAFDLLTEGHGHRQSDGARYSIFQVKSSATEEAYGNLGRARASELARRFAGTNVTVLELAATVDWLWRQEGYRTGWREEISRRKYLKVQNGRLDKAVALLEELGLPPPIPEAVPAS